jgi:transglutaminase-like putative cysteine protease
MRIHIDHETRYQYDAPVRGVCQVLRLRPRPHDGQHIVSWRIDVDVDGKLREGEDAFGNHLLLLSADGPIEALTLHVAGEVDTQDAAGVLSGVPELLPPEVYTRETALTLIDPDLAVFARDTAGRGDDPLAKLHALLAGVHAEVAYEMRPGAAPTTAAGAFAERRGACQDLAHIFIACARHLGAPARYVSGHHARLDGVVEQEASHAWAEALVPGLGWVGFDPSTGACPAERHVRVACGFDHLSAAPVRGSRLGGGTERLSIRLAVSPMEQSAPLPPEADGRRQTQG